MAVKYAIAASAGALRYGRRPASKCAIVYGNGISSWAPMGEAVFKVGKGGKCSVYALVLASLFIRFAFLSLQKRRRSGAQVAGFARQPNRFGVRPGTLLTDSGGPVISEIVREACDECGTRVRRISANAPYTSGVVERRAHSAKAVVQVADTPFTTQDQAIKNTYDANDAVNYRPPTILEGFSPCAAETGKNSPALFGQGGQTSVKGTVRERQNMETVLQQLHADNQPKVLVEQIQERARKQFSKSNDRAGQDIEYKTKGTKPKWERGRLVKRVAAKTWLAPTQRPQPGSKPNEEEIGPSLQDTPQWGLPSAVRKICMGSEEPFQEEGTLTETDPMPEETTMGALGESVAEEGEGIGEREHKEQFSVPPREGPVPTPEEETRIPGTTRSGQEYLAAMTGSPGPKGEEAIKGTRELKIARAKTGKLQKL